MTPPDPRDAQIEELKQRNLELQASLLQSKLAHAQDNVKILISQGQEWEQELSVVREALKKYYPQVNGPVIPMLKTKEPPGGTV